MGFPSTAKPKVKIQSHQAAVWGASLKVPAPNTQRILPAWIPTHELTLFLTDPTICTQGIINSGVVLTLFRPHIQDGRSFVLDSPGACLRPCPAADICAARQERRQEFKDVVTVAWHMRTCTSFKFHGSQHQPSFLVSPAWIHQSTLTHQVRAVPLNVQPRAARHCTTQVKRLTHHATHQARLNRDAVGGSWSLWITFWR